MFNEKELKILNSITEKFSKKAKHAKLLNFEEFVGRWYQFVERVEKGYTMTIDDYANDLTKRDLIEELNDELPPTIKKKVTSLIKSWDNRFDTATNSLQNPIFKEGDQPWWQYRLPKKLIEDLKEDVERLEIK